MASTATSIRPGRIRGSGARVYVRSLPARPRPSREPNDHDPPPPARSPGSFPFRLHFRTEPRGLSPAAKAESDIPACEFVFALIIKYDI